MGAFAGYSSDAFITDAERVTPYYKAFVRAYPFLIPVQHDPKLGAVRSRVPKATKQLTLLLYITTLGYDRR